MMCSRARWICDEPPTSSTAVRSWGLSPAPLSVRRNASTVDSSAGAAGGSPYFQRWLCYWRYLRDHPEIDQVWCVAGTDVEMLRDPFPEMEDRLYLSDEPSPLCIPRMVYHHGGSETLLRFLAANRGAQLLNAGLAGGSRRVVLDFCRDVF